MEMVLIGLIFGTILSLVNAREIVNENSGSDVSSHGEGGDTAFVYGDKKTDDKFHAYLNPYGNIVFRVAGGTLEKGGGLYPTISENGEVVYTKSEYKNRDSYDSSTIIYGDIENSRIKGSDGFDGRGVLDVGSDINLEGSRHNADYSGFKGFSGVGGNSDNESKYKTNAIMASVLSGRPNAVCGDLSRLTENSGGYVRDQYGYSGVNNGLESNRYGKRVRGLRHIADILKLFQWLASLVSAGRVNPPRSGYSILSQLAGGGLIPQKLGDEHGNSNRQFVHNVCGSGSCDGHSNNGKYAFASATASAGNYGR